MDKVKISQAGDIESPVTVPPRLAPQSQSSYLTPHPVRTSASPFPIIQRPQSSPPHAILEPGGSSGPISDLMPHLHRSAPSIVKTRSGSVLSRGFILKTDHYPSGKSPINLFARLSQTRIPHRESTRSRPERSWCPKLPRAQSRQPERVWRRTTAISGTEGHPLYS
jgi:hypothetical protein